MSYKIGAREGTGLQCPECRQSKMVVVATEPRNNGRQRWRRRECPECGHRVTTREEVAASRNGGRKRLDVRTLEITEDLERRFMKRLETMIEELAYTDPGLVAEAMAEAASEEFGALCEEIVEDRGEGWVT